MKIPSVEFYLAFIRKYFLTNKADQVFIVLKLAPVPRTLIYCQVRK